MTGGCNQLQQGSSIPNTWHLCTVCVAQIAGKVLAVAEQNSIAAFRAFVGFCIGEARRESLY